MSRLSLLLCLLTLALAACSSVGDYPDGRTREFYRALDSERTSPQAYEQPQAPEDPSVCVGQWCSCESY